MSNPTDPRREHPSTYFVQDRSNEEELLRVQTQDQMITARMGGVLPEQPNPAIFQRVIDIGSGTGEWLLEAARTYPTISKLVGVDASSKMVEYAQAQAKVQQVSDRVQFRPMDILFMLEFPPNYFELINQRFGWSFLRTWDWPKLLLEYQRVTRPGGVIRITESDMIVSSGSPALERLLHLFFEAFCQAGHFFIPKENGVTSELARLLHQYGLRNVQTQVHTLDYRAGTVEGQRFYDDMRYIFRTAVPFIHKWTRVPDDYQTIYQQMLSEIQQPGFVATWTLLTAWGQKAR
jgi:ubiquinone/menaquinone biosynthesis C-methylase UbiE